MKKLFSKMGGKIVTTMAVLMTLSLYLTKASEACTVKWHEPEELDVFK